MIIIISTMRKMSNFLVSYLKIISLESVYTVLRIKNVYILFINRSHRSYIELQMQFIELPRKFVTIWKDRMA